MPSRFICVEEEAGIFDASVRNRDGAFVNTLGREACCIALSLCCRDVV